MKKILSLIAAVFCLSAVAKAAPGDTTWVQANNVQLSYYNNYDTTITFPSAGTTYRKIIMVFTLGKYMCPAGSTYCGDWDYTVQNILMTPGGDTLELGRFITPYANAAAPRTPWAWKQHYVYDVTDYASVLHGSATMRIFFSGYSGGFTGNIRFAFIEGTPERNVLGVKQLWQGSYAYGDTSHSDSNVINIHYPALTETAPAGTQSAEMKFTVTGHGFDALGCCEFATHNYQVQVNGSTVWNKAIWRSDCGSNELYPQSGTWLYERANWCPGAMVYSDHIALPGVTDGSTFNTNITFDPYIGNGGSYTTFATLFYYGPVNHTTDASLDYVVAPTKDENFFRENPVIGKPVIHVKNTGSTVINSMDIQFGVSGTTPLTYTWNGSLDAHRDTDVTLPILPALNDIAGTSGTYTFTATITAVNGSADEDNTNNSFTSQFIAAPYWPLKFAVVMKTNNEADASGNSETSWAIYDLNDNLIRQRTGASLSTLYRDTIISGPGDYKLVITDGSCDGLNWWVNAGSGITSGFLNIKKINAAGTNIPMNGYNYSGTYNNDFGCGFTQYFRVEYPLAITNISTTAATIEVYPNPAQNTINISIDGMTNVHGTLHMIDALGREVMTTACNDTHQQVNVSGLANGVYTIQFSNGTEQIQTRIVIGQ